jgi:DNA-binding IclR family transcriptional regulator
MTFLEKIQHLERLDQLIRHKATGSPDEIATRMQIARSTVYELVDCLRFFGAEVEYCRVRKTFYYIGDKKFNIGFESIKNIKGGKKIEEFYKLF